MAVTVRYLGHAAFVIEADGKQVVIDPFLTGNPLAAAKPEELSPVAILVTHAHNDHVGDAVAISKRTKAPIIATFELGSYLASQGAEAIPANHGGTVKFDGGSAKLVPAWHTSTYGDTFAAPGVPAGFVVRFGGKVLYFAGDTCLFGDMALIGEEGLDLAVLPIGDHFTMGPADAVRAVKLLKPRVVIPCHYNTFPPIQQDPHAFKRDVEAQTEAVCVVLAPGEQYTLA
ncbi:metal-dependent hydrolase [Thermorudis peleae]|uniref:metal-dependent hydrolase n=1 Tax=Thermorudis peleae TaxID=1382356 RepID=UPI00056EE82E|nr:metal-dependent hydrolase [Thermorudis peleae]MBX6753791.1 metal-dependent hydrolase [Thermorudis peleae]